jgi:cobalt-zinc-cadmium efflux system membrane fusion protein
MYRTSLLKPGLLLIVGMAAGGAGMYWLVRPSTSDFASNADASVLTSSASIGQQASAGAEGEASDWCFEHRVPESLCTGCHPELMATFKANNDWCGEHGVPESQCRLCNPGLTFAQEPPPIATPALSLEASVFFPRNRVECATNNAIIQFASAETAARAGLSVEPALESVESSSVEAPAELLFDETRTYAVTTAVPATVLRWLLEPGERVTENQGIAELQSPDMAAMKAEYLEAMSESALDEQNRVRADSLHQRRLISAAEFELATGSAAAARTHVQGTRGLLRAAGLSDEDIALLEQGHDFTSRWLLRAPANGYLLERKAPLGELLEPGTGLALVGDPSALWIEAHVRERDLQKFRAGQKVEFSVDGDALGRASGRVFWVSQFIDAGSRTGTVRARLEGKNTGMSAHRFGRLLLDADSGSGAVAVPMDAVQWEGCCNVVFVQEAVDRYRPRKVSIERGGKGYYNVTSGLQPGEFVVVRGSYLLKTELKKSSLGAGCCDIDAKS